MIATGFMDCGHSSLAVAFLTLGVAVIGCQWGSGYLVNPVDIAPRYAGVILGISNTFATIPGFLAPLAIGQITTNVRLKNYFICFGSLIDEKTTDMSTKHMSKKQRITKPGNTKTRHKI